MSRRLVQILFLLGAFALGGWLMYRYLRPKAKPVENSTVLLEKIRPVLKLTTIEGQFSEVYTYENPDGYLVNLWDKKVIVRVQATVSAGYDLSALQVDADSVGHVLSIGPLPDIQILSVDHKLEYFDVQTGAFGSLAPSEMNMIEQNAKQKILEAAEKSGLKQAAREQADKAFDIIRFMGESAGWKVEIAQAPPAPSLQ